MEKLTVAPTLGSSELEVEVAKKGSGNEKMIPPVRGQIKRRIFACSMKKMKHWTQNSLKFLFCNSKDPS
ncbi:hypothetical protein NC652_013149 [Populus alba x Populus x berolinensis]|uniref:Uncharacterized protein n=2 Tax=Populus TaxID=3689 RepID=A0ACC4C8K0_POPAL|nr:hypothetical protein NC652_013149 [Populus alba x Populus x berolinensis]KAJ6996397.1 hypothetical protein NC653_013108 [Populus alba x Populus x berolinensis]